MTVFLVGAGPGDPGLMTVRGAELLRAADVVLYDRLIPDGVLDGLEAELVYVGKQGGGPQMPQEEITRLLLDYGARCETVVRLKGGDPFVFGRGGEEAEALREAGIAFEVVPGVTAGVAAPAYAGVPVTQRGMASAVAFVTGHEDPAKPETAIDWEALARFPGTLVFYMGVKSLPRIASKLVEGGRPGSEPVAVVERGTMPGQKTVLSTLDAVAVDAADVRAPAITLVGPVAGLRESIAWLERRPLHGVSVAVTRARAQASPMAARLRALGAVVVEAPTIRISPLPADIPDLSAYDHVIVSSPNAASELLGRLRDARALAGVRVAAMGPGTARELRTGGVAADVVPQRAVAEGMLEALTEVRRALVVRAKEARDVLVDGLRERGAEADVLALYETVAEPLSEDARAATAAADFITFTSASTVRFLAAACDGALPDGPRLVSIGPATSAELRAHGREPDLEADPHTPDGLVAALVAAD